MCTLTNMHAAFVLIYQLFLLFNCKKFTASASVRPERLPQFQEKQQNRRETAPAELLFYTILRCSVFANDSRNTGLIQKPCK